MKLPQPDLHHILEKTTTLWGDIRGARLFITGGTGFFGTWLLESFLYANNILDLKASASILTRQPESFRANFPHLTKDPAIRLIPGDVRNFDLPQEQYTHIIHAATEASAILNAENPLLMLDTIVEGTRRVLEFAIQSQAQRLLFTSSGAVYGKQPGTISHIPEEYNGAPDPLDPSSAYATGKRTAEHLCALFAKQYGLNVTIARCFAFVGPRLPLNAHFAIGNFIRDALNDDPIIIKGDGTPYRSYLYAADLAIWLWTILLRGEANRSYNVGSETALTIAETARLTAQCTNSRYPVIIQKESTPGKAPEQYVPAIQRAKIELGLQTWVKLDDGIKRTYEFSKATQS